LPDDRTKLAVSQPNGDVTATLTIEGLKLSDAGEIKAVAKNPAGEVSAVARLNVIGRLHSIL
jgi:hypothetical protein